MSDLKKKILLIVNPRAGRTKTRAGIVDIVDKFSKSDYEFSVHTTTCQGDATNIVKKELKDHDMVVCCGGDGTLNETVNGVMDMPRRVPIGYIPAGSTNDLATTLGIPSSLKEATDLIINGNTNDYDVGLFNNRYFTYVASFGAFTRASYATNQTLKNWFGHAAYFPAAIPDAFKMKSYRLRIEYDGGVIEDRFYFGSISNSTSVAGFFKFKEEDVKLNDGIFEVLLVRNVKFHTIIPLLHQVRSQKYNGNEIIFLRTSKLKVTCLDEAVDWTLDGEYGGAHNNVMVHVLERAVDICSTDNHLFIKHEAPVYEPAQEAEEPKERKLLRKRKTAKVEEAQEVQQEESEIPAEEPAQSEETTV